MRKNIIIFLVLMIMMTIPMTAFANKEEESGMVGVYVHDHANLLTDSQEEALLKYINEAKELQWNILFLTYNDANEKSIEVYTDDYMNTLFPDYENNIAFVIDMDNREWYVNTMGEAIKEISDSEVEDILDGGEAIYDANYYGCLNGMAKVAFKSSGSTIVTKDKTGITNILKNGFGVGVGATVICAAFLLIQHFSANKKVSAQTYMGSSDYKILSKNKILARTYTTIDRNYYKPSSSSSGSSSGGSSHRSSSGRSHGGGGRKF